MVRHFLILILGLALVSTACGDGGAETPGRPGPVDPVVIGEPPTPDPGDPGADPGESWILGPAYIENVDARVIGPGQVRLTVTGDLPTPCHEAMVDLVDPGSGRVLDLEVWSRTGSDEVCIQVLAPFTITTEAGGLAAGTYSVRSGGKELLTVEIPDESSGPSAELFDGIFPASDWAEFELLVGRVADGHQPWLLDPLATAEAYLRDLFDDVPTDLTFHELEQGAGEVTWADGRVTLMQYRAAGPWVVTAVESSAVDVSISDYSGGVLYVGLNPQIPGRVEVHAGAFASEWSSEFVQDVLAGEAVEVELQLGEDDRPGPERILVDIRLTDAEGNVSIARYGVNRTNIVYDD